MIEALSIFDFFSTILSIMSKTRFNFSFLFIVFFIVSCGGPDAQSLSLTREDIRRLLQNAHLGQEQLKSGTYHGCIHIPAEGFIQSKFVGFKRTGESCSITINENNTINVNFLEEVTVSLASVSIDVHRANIFIGELENNQVLVVQHHQGEVVSVTQKMYHRNDVVVFGQSDYIKECHFGMTTAEKLAGRKNCRR